jgi:predicted SnoaL-like aldol condensation-catalyzing enzyme
MSKPKTIEAHVIQLKAEGWCLVEGVIPKDQVDDLRDHVMEGHQKALQAYESWGGSLGFQTGPNGEPGINAVAYVPKLAPYFGDERDETYYTEHNPHIADGLMALRSALTERNTNNERKIKHDRIHRLLAERSFVLCVSEGFQNGVHSSFYDLFRVVDGKLVAHWDTTETVPPRTEWKNENGKF